MTPFEAHVLSILNAIAVTLFSAVLFYITGLTWVWAFSLLAWLPMANFFLQKYERKP